MKLWDVSELRVLPGLIAAASLWTAASAIGADVALQIPLKAPAASASAFDWIGWYFGGQFGFASGYSKWTAAEAGAAAPTLGGSFGLFNAFNGFGGDGSYFAGLQAGYNQRLGSRLILGAEVDVAFPSFPVGLVGAQRLSSPLVGQANYQDSIAYTGTARGRLGYVLDNNWLIYGTGGVAFAYDKLERIQIAGMPADGTATTGAVQRALLWRLGWTIGAGLEVPVAPHWTTARA
jgi:high affinity Mn2+ porin